MDELREAARELGRRGGVARAERLSPERKKAISEQGVKARLKKAKKRKPRQKSKDALRGTNGPDVPLASD